MTPGADKVDRNLAQSADSVFRAVGDLSTRRSCQASQVFAEVERQALRGLAELEPIAAEERAGDIFEVGYLGAHDAQKAVRSLDGLACAVFGGLLLAGNFDELAQGDRRPAGLGFEPLPMARQQGDLAGYHA
jgi:hypothetical protein